MAKQKKISKNEKLLRNLIQTTQQFMQGRSYSPMTESELFTRLQLPPQHRSAFKEVLKRMIEKGFLEKKGNRLALFRSSNEVVTGIVRMHPRGFGFVQPQLESKLMQDVFIPKNLTMNAVDGDKVEVLVNLKTMSDKGPEGKIISILDRARSHVAGTIRRVEKDGTVVAYVPLLGRSTRVVIEPNSEHSFSKGERVVLEMVEWGDQKQEAYCRLSHVIGHINDPSCDVVAAVEEFGLKDRFPVVVQEEASQYPDRVLPKDLEGRVDFRGLECITIDPDTARDFDDALTLSIDSKGNYHLGVHIADVTHYVPEGSEIDKEARLRCNSVYFPGTVLPMLPEKLANHLCSLKPNVNRLAVSVLMDFSPTGEMYDYRICRSVIRSDKRYTYKEAKKILDGKMRSKHKGLIEEMVSLCGHFKKLRYERGSIEFALPELIVKVDEKGRSIGTEYVEYDITHQLVEEFMLKANETVAKYLDDKRKNFTYRIHDEPSEENIKDFTLLARAFGYDVPDSPSPAELQKLFDKAQSTPFGPYLATSFIRRMKMASYSPDNIGHYGLALTHYCHFTSPIRRYADIVVHRVLFGVADDIDEVQAISARCSDQERVSSKAESSVVLLKKLRLLDEDRKKNPYREFEAVVTRIKPFGFFFEVIDYMVEGFYHIAELDKDFYNYQEENMRLEGRSTGHIYEPGKKITVMLGEIDLVVQEVKWYLIPEEFEGKIQRPQKEQKKIGKRKKPFNKRRKKQ